MEPTQQGSLPFLDTLVTIQPDNTLSTTVYRKPTHTDQYLHWDSNHHITATKTMYSPPWHIGPVQFLPHRTAWTKNWTTSKQHSNTVSSPSGPSTSGTTGSSSHTAVQHPHHLPTTIQQTKPKPRPP